MTLPVLGDWIIFSDTQLHHTWPLQWIILTIQMMNFFKLVYGGLFQTPNDNQCSSFRHVPLKIIVINTPVSYTMIISKLSIHSDYHCDWNQCSLQWFFGDQCNLHWFEVWILPTVILPFCRIYDMLEVILICALSKYGWWTGRQVFMERRLPKV